MSRKLSKMERKLQRKAMLARIARGEVLTDTDTESQPSPQGLGSSKPETPEDPAAKVEDTWQEAKRLVAERRDEPDAAPVQERIQRVLETSAAELEQAEIEVLDELLAAAREGVALHKAEAKARTEAQQRGEPITTRWQVAPGVFEKLSGRILRIIEIKLRHRRGQSHDRQAA